jgi:hypothetical protein
VTFCIVSSGWQCAEWLEQTLASVEAQSYHDWRIQIVYDPSTDDGAERIRRWCDARDARWGYRINTTHLWAPRNQYEAIQTLAPADEDVVVFLDLDGDMLAHPDVLAHLLGYYADETLVTYGNYRPIPDLGLCPPAEPFPPEVIAAGSYRAHIASGRACCFNHTRTMKGKVAKAISPDGFCWPDGTWYEGPADYLFMIPALELAGPRHKCLTEVVCLYNNANPYADNLVHPQASTAGCLDCMSRPPLAMLP